MLKVVIIGYGEMFTNLIAGTLDSGCEIVGVLRKDTIKYRKFHKYLRDKFNPSREYSYIKSYDLHEINAKSVNSKEFKKELLKLNPDIILVGSWGERIRQEIFDFPKIATINAHPSLLPKYRGPNPYFWTIRNMENYSGVTFHLVTKGYDKGAILAQEEIKIYPSDTGKSLKERTVLVARGVVCELLKALQEDVIIPLTQIEEKSTYYSQPEDIELNFNKTAEENDALIRAIHPWEEAYLFHHNTCLSIISHKTEIKDNNTTFTQNGTIVEIDTKNKTLGILCSNKKILTIKVERFPMRNNFLTQNYIKKEIKIGDIITKEELID